MLCFLSAGVGPAQVQVVHGPLLDPPGFTFYDSAYDTQGDRLLAFDLWSGAMFSAPSGTATWSPEPPSPGAPALRLAMSVYDATRERLVLFGGAVVGQAQPTADTWEFDGAQWTQIPTPVTPPARFGGVGCHRADTGMVVMAGGYVSVNSAPVTLDDTWSYDGTTWVQLAASGLTQPASIALAADTSRGVVVAYSGVATHELGPAGWVTVPTAAAPPPRELVGLGYDPRRRRCVTFGGRDLGTGAQLADFWEYDGATWTQRLPSSATFAPQPRTSVQMHYDPDSRAVLVVGGFRQTGNVIDQPGEVVLYAPTVDAESGVFAAGCAAIAGRPELVSSELPWLGRSLQLQVQLAAGDAAVVIAGVSDQVSGTVALPAPLGAFGLEGCRQLCSAEAVTVPIAGVNGVAAVGLSIPNAAVLLGAALFAQAVVPPPATGSWGTSSGFAVTDGIRLVVGSS